MNPIDIPFNINPFNFLILSGIVQSMIVSFILFFKKEPQHNASRWLSIVTLIISLHLFGLILIDFGFEVQYPHLLWIPWDFLTVIGPILFIYSEKKINPIFKLDQKYFKFFLPLIIELSIHILEIFYANAHSTKPYKTTFYLITRFLVYIWSAGSIFYFIKRSSILIKHHQKKLVNHYADISQYTLTWLLQLFTYFKIIWICWIPFVLILLLSFKYNLNHISLVILLYGLIMAITYLNYWMALKGLLKSNQVLKEGISNQPEPSNYQKLKPDQLAHYDDQIKSLICSKSLFQDENLSLKSLASELGKDPNLISYVINAHMGQNFYELINGYRVEYVKAKLQDPTYNHYKLLAIGFDAGFSSKSTFNRVFKQMEGITPNQYKKQINNS